MKSFIKSGSFILFVVTILLAMSPSALAKKMKLTYNPDFTKGEKIPEGATHDWTLGATGMRGWMYSDGKTNSDARQVSITEVAKGSPADGVLTVGDVILGVAGKPFSDDPRIGLGKALTVAESEAGGGKLSLTRWRSGTQEEVVLKLPVLGTYSATAPFDCPKSKRILELGCEVLAKKIQQPGYDANPIVRSLNALALLASGDPKYLPVVRKEAEWASKFSAESMATWYYGYVLMLLSEYQMSTGDATFMPGMRRLALEAAKGQGLVGSWGHKFADPEGILQGYGMMNAAGVTMSTGLVLARKAGVEDPEVEVAIERSAKLLRFYVDKGTIPYGDHAPWMDSHDSNGKNSMSAVFFDVLGEAHGAQYFSRMALGSHGAERDGGHTGNFWNITWAMPGVSRSGSDATGVWMGEYGAWYYDLARRWDGTFIHQGPPAAKGDHTDGWDATGAFLLAYATPLKKIHLTGKRSSDIQPLPPERARQIVREGGNRSKAFYENMTVDQIVGRLSSWSPILREDAAKVLAGRESATDAIPAVIKLLDSPDLNARYGACQALAKYGEKAVVAVPALRKAMNAEDTWVRVLSAIAVGEMGEAGKVAVPDMLKRIAQDPAANDPRGIEQRFLCSVVFKNMIDKSIEGIDRDLLRNAIVAGLGNEHGDARDAAAKVYKMLSYDEIKPLLLPLRDAIVHRPISGPEVARVEGLNVLAKYHYKEGIPLCVSVLDPERHGNYWRVPRTLEVLTRYGAAAKPVLPQLREMLEAELANPKFKEPSPNSVIMREAIKAIEQSTSAQPLQSLDSP